MVRAGNDGLRDLEIDGVLIVGGVALTLCRGGRLGYVCVFDNDNGIHSGVSRCSTAMDAGSRRRNRGWGHGSSGSARSSDRRGRRGARAGMGGLEGNTQIES